MVVAARVVKLESVALLVARMDAAMIQIAAAYNYSTVTDLFCFNMRFAPQCYGDIYHHNMSSNYSDYLNDLKFYRGE